MFHRKGDPFLTLNIGKMEKAIFVKFDNLNDLNDLLSEGWKVKMIVPDHPSTAGGNYSSMVSGNILIILEKNRN